VPVADATVWVTHADASLLVVKQGKTPKQLLKEALASVENLKLLGIVMNESPDVRHQYYRQYYKNSGYGKASKSPTPSLPVGRTG
jgi:Mrp family chromosome partitioning ATPase